MFTVMYKRKDLIGWVWWCLPVILATWEVEIKRIVVPGYPEQKVSETSSQLTT
jgi:hypothetical protein